MFWQFNYQSSEIENLLNKEDVTLIELLNEEDILQECKAQNTKLIDLLSLEDNIRNLVDLIVDEPDSNLETKVQYKLPVRACEILTSNVASLNDGLVANDATLAKLLSYVDSSSNDHYHELNPLQASLFAKLFQHLCTSRPTQMMEKMEGQLLGQLVGHVGTSAIMDSILHLSTLDSFSPWLTENDFLTQLIETFSFSHSREEKENVCCVMVELLKRWRDVSPPPPTSTTHLFAIHIQQEATCLKLLEQMLGGDGGADVVAAESSLAAGLTFFIHMLTPSQFVRSENVENELVCDGVLNALAARWSDLHQLLTHPPQQMYRPMATSWGCLRLPVGRVRLLLVQLIAVCIPHSSQHFNNQLQLHKTPTTILDLYFEYVWNNLLHTQVEACINALLNNNNNHNAIQQLLSDYKLLEKIISVFQKYEKGVGVAHLGNLVNISNSLQQHLQQQPDIQQQKQLTSPYVGLDVESWNMFVESDLSRLNNLNNNQLISGWTGNSDMLDSGCTNDFNVINFDTEIASSDGRLMRLFGIVEERLMAGGCGGMLDGEEMSCDVLSGGGGGADVFEALCSQRNRPDDDPFATDDDMFAACDDAQQCIRSLHINQQSHGWANFADVNIAHEDHPKPNDKNADSCNTEHVTNSEDWADFDSINSNKSEMKCDGTSVDN